MCDPEVLLAAPKLTDSERLDAIPTYGLHLMCDEVQMDGEWIKIWRITIQTADGTYTITCDDMRHGIDRAVYLHTIHAEEQTYDRAKLN